MYQQKRHSDRGAFFVMRMARLELASLAAEDFESSASTIPPLGPTIGCSQACAARQPARKQPAQRSSNPGASQTVRGKSVAVGHLAGFPADHEPARPLLGGAMGEGVGHRALPGTGLQGVVTDLSGRIHRLFQIPPLDHAEGLRGLTRPNAGIAVGLQFHLHRNGIAFGLVDLLPDPVRLTKGAKLILDVMPDLMGHDIGCRKVAPGPKAL